jgi:hypothetical protein
MNSNQPVDIAWRAYRALLKQEGLDSEAMWIAQQSYKDGWHECEQQNRADVRIEVLEAALVKSTVNFAAAISLLERTPEAKQAASSDTMFGIMLADYRKALNTARAALDKDVET